MESEFVSLCDYNLFVSAELYTQYYIAVREINNPFNQVRSGIQGKQFNRFKSGEIDPRQYSQKRLQRLDFNHGGEIQG